MDDFKVPTLLSLPPQKDTKKDDVKQESPSEADDSIKLNTPEQKSNCPYKIPPWSAPPPPSVEYKFEVLKSGQIIEVYQLQKKAFFKFGRLTENDIEMAHPTISRFHAILQYSPNTMPQTEEDNDGEQKELKQPPNGWYVYDLDSTHGTFLNKQRIPPRVFIPIRVGHILRLGASTRSYILQGPVEDEEPESELSVTELREQRQQQLAEAAAEAVRKAAEKEERERTEGISWGMAEDADEETDLTHNPYASTNNEELFLDDPKRTLRGYFEREGLPLEYKCDEMSAGSFVCRVELPLDDANGRPIVAEVIHKGRKKDCVVQCALEACRILDRHGVLRQANQEPLKRKLKPQNSDSDDDDFWDRTGDIERKKSRKANASASQTLTYEDLLKQESELIQQLEEVKNSIASYQNAQKRLRNATSQEEAEADDLDNFMENLSEDVRPLDKTEIRKLILEEQRLKAEQQKVNRLLKIAKPLELSLFKNPESTTQNPNKTEKDGVKRQLPIIGKRNQFSKFKVVKLPQVMTVTVTEKNTTALGSDEEEVEEDEGNKSVPKATGVDCEEQQAKNKQVVVGQKNKKGEGECIKHYGPAIMPSDTFATEVESAPPEQLGSTEGNITAETPSQSELKAIEEQNDNAKKRRQRQRTRYKRQDVDTDDLEEHESSEKYAKWVPPENQSGDGYTQLNEKYGY